MIVIVVSFGVPLVWNLIVVLRAAPVLAAKVTLNGWFVPAAPVVVVGSVTQLPAGTVAVHASLEVTLKAMEVAVACRLRASGVLVTFIVGAGVEAAAFCLICTVSVLSLVPVVVWILMLAIRAAVVLFSSRVTVTVPLLEPVPGATVAHV